MPADKKAGLHAIVPRRRRAWACGSLVSTFAPIGFDDAEARKIFAGSDFTLMPSRFEPCGLSQMYAQRFGSLPIGHRTGGLAETIVDGETGFLFDRASAPGFLGSLLPGLLDLRHEDRLDHMRRAAMAQAFSWSQSAKSYAALYRSSI